METRYHEQKVVATLTIDVDLESSREHKQQKLAYVKRVYGLLCKGAPMASGAIRSRHRWRGLFATSPLIGLARVCQLSLLDERIDEPPRPRPRPTRNGNPLPRKHMGARAGQWDLHAAVTVAQGKRDELLRLCKYIVRSPLALERMELLPDGRIRYALRRPRHDGGTCIELDPVDLVARLTAMIPPHGRHMVRYHGIRAPAAPQRADDPGAPW